MRKAGVVTIFILLIIAVFTWSAYSAVREQRDNLEATHDYGIGGGPGIDLNSLNTQTSLDENIKLSGLFQEHAIALNFHLQDLYDGKDTTETTGRLQNNSIKIAEAFNRELRVDEGAFLSMWDEHIKEFESYALALKINNREATEQSRSGLNEHAMKMGTLINKVQPDIPASEISRLMNEHIDLTLSVLEAHARGDTSEKLTQATKTSTQAVAFAEAIIAASN